MGNYKAVIKQADATRLFKAARDAGFGSARITIHPDGRIEASGSTSEAKADERVNTWDDVVK